MSLDLAIRKFLRFFRLGEELQITGDPNPAPGHSILRVTHPSLLKDQVLRRSIVAALADASCTRADSSNIPGHSDIDV